jgi:siroheme synthase-like protein
MLTKDLEEGCNTMHVYPIFLTELAARRCLVIGGDDEAERKVQGLLDCEASVTVLSASLTAQLHDWVRNGTITWIPRAYEPGDLQGAFLAIVTDKNTPMTEHLCQEAHNLGTLLNVADDPAHSVFVAGSVVRQGPLTIAISTSGCAPALAVRLRQQFERDFGPEYAVLLDLLRELRASLAGRDASAQERRALWYRLLDSDLLELLRAGHYDLARQLIALILGDNVPEPGELTRLDGHDMSLNIEKIG